MISWKIYIWFIWRLPVVFHNISVLLLQNTWEQLWVLCHHSISAVQPATGCSLVKHLPSKYSVPPPGGPAPKSKHRSILSTENWNRLRSEPSVTAEAVAGDRRRPPCSSLETQESPAETKVDVSCSCVSWGMSPVTAECHREISIHLHPTSMSSRASRDTSGEQKPPWGRDLTARLACRGGAPHI